MKKTVFKNLLKRIKNADISLEIVENFLKAKENVLEVVANVEDENFEDALLIVANLTDNNIPSIDILACLNIYLNAKDYQKKCFYNYLILDSPAQNKFVLEGLNILKMAENETILKSSLNALTSKKLYDLNIHLKLAKIIANVSAKDSIEYIENLYIDKEITDVNDLIMSASIISGALNNFNARYAYFLLNNENLRVLNKQYEAANLIVLAKNEYNARYAFTVLKYFASKNIEYAFSAAKIIILAKEVYQAHYAEELLINENVEDECERLYSAKLLTKAKDNSETSYIYKLYKTPYFLSMGLSHVLSSLIVEEDSVLNAQKLREIIDSNLKLTILKEELEKIIKPLEETMPKEYEKGINIFNNILNMVFNTSLNIEVDDEEAREENNFFTELIIEVDNIDNSEICVEEVRKRVLKRREEI